LFYITFHKTESNVWAYDHKGNQKTTKLLGDPTSPTKLDELRGISFGPNGYLYVVNGDKKQNQVLVYNGSGDGDDAYTFLGIYGDATVSTGIAHPFAVAFDSNNNGYVSSQDTNVVTGLTPPSPNPAQPPYPKASTLGIASFLTTTASGFLPGTFVASCYGALDGVSPAPPNVATPQGLDVDPPQGPASHSVRGVTVIDNLLYVADEPGNAVKVYALATIQFNGQTFAQGQLYQQITADNLQGPVHLLVNNGVLYITSSESCVLAYDAEKGKVATFLSGLQSPAGMAFDSDGNFFFADRTGCAIYECAYDSKKKTYGEPMVFIPPYDKKSAPDGLQDQPEFLLYVNDPS
jgi:hypothetical protein